MKHWFSAGLLLLVLLTTACSDVKDGQGVGKYGMMAENTPEYTAVRFMQVIYHEDSLDEALELSSERMARLLNNYHTNRNVQRYVISQLYDEVEISPDSGDTVGRTEFADKAQLTLLFTGFYDEDKIIELRKVSLVKESGDWKVDKVEVYPY
ncbi:hypothetical protein QTP81_10235 [Alteromonas sp. ASW11-36]|uniref:Lipoprotein n=1 Tax=Alteromonas arenosi TaxID=3055817 RepID=A0ABT7SXR4_9ALTE|nr:hypothetical protein [Alteromonas sp. ASW11-36]MDM7860975.1 hypothetical protein [Alteromonas sp. ASW11-36]